MISASTGQGLEELRRAIADALQESYAPVTFRIPFTRYGILAQIRPLGRVIAEQHTEEGTELTIVLARDDVSRLVRQHGEEILKN